MVVWCREQVGEAGAPTKPGCGRLYDDAEQWTICPHGPLGSAPGAYCLEHDLVDCHMHGTTQAGPEAGEEVAHG